MGDCRNKELFQLVKDWLRDNRDHILSKVSAYMVLPAGRKNGMRVMRVILRAGDQAMVFEVVGSKVSLLQDLRKS